MRGFLYGLNISWNRFWMYIISQESDLGIAERKELETKLRQQMGNFGTVVSSIQTLVFGKAPNRCLISFRSSGSGTIS